MKILINFFFKGSYSKVEVVMFWKYLIFKEIVDSCAGVERRWFDTGHGRWTGRAEWRGYHFAAWNGAYHGRRREQWWGKRSSIRNFFRHTPFGSKRWLWFLHSLRDGVGTFLQDFLFAASAEAFGLRNAFFGNAGRWFFDNYFLRNHGSLWLGEGHFSLGGAFNESHFLLLFLSICENGGRKTKQAGVNIKWHKNDEGIFTASATYFYLMWLGMRARLHYSSLWISVCKVETRKIQNMLSTPWRGPAIFSITTRFNLSQTFQLYGLRRWE